jgi:hypothetical protein
MYIGKIRFFVNVLDDNKFELLEQDIFYDELISINSAIIEVEETFYCCFQEISEKIFLKEDIDPGNVFEIIADLYYELEKTYCFEYNLDEYDSLCWVENEKHVKLTEEQIKNMD